MSSIKEENFMISKRIMRIIGFYQLASPYYNIKVFGVHFFKFLSKIQCILLIIFLCISIANFSNSIHDIDNVINYGLLTIVNVLLISKFYCVILNTHRIWRCVKMLSINNLSYKYHSIQILKMGKIKSKIYSIYFIASWLMIVAAWWISPFIVDNYYINITTKKETYKYRYNIFNLVFPASDKFYNDHFLSYYIIEALFSMFMAHSTIIYEILVISMCIVITYQLKTVANSYNDFNIKQFCLISKLRSTMVYVF